MRNLLQLAFPLLALLLFAAAPPAAVAGMQVTPLIMEIPNSPGASGSFRVANTGTGAIPVEVAVIRRELNANGKIVSTPADGDFVIFPPQAVIPGQQAQQFRFQYLAPNNPAVSTSYYIFARQLPVDLDAEEIEDKPRFRVNVLFEYGVAVHAIPSNAAPDFVVRSAKPTTLKNGKRGVALQVENRGNRFGRIAEHEITVSLGGRTETYRGVKLEERIGRGLLLPGQVHNMKLRTDAAPTGRIEAAFEYVGG